MPRVSRPNARVFSCRACALTTASRLRATWPTAARADAILLVVPAQAMRSVCTALAKVLTAPTPLIACAKGIEHGTHKFMTEIIAECAPKAMPAILSGPSFAADVARGLPTAVTMAAAERQTGGRAGAGDRVGELPPLSFDRRARRRARRCHQERAGDRGGHRHRPRTRRQRRGGIDHARLRGTDAFRQGLRCQARDDDRPFGTRRFDPDLLEPQSRNFSFGVALGKGEKPDGAAHGKLAEGAFTAPVLLEMAREKNVDMPISAAVAAVLADKLSVDKAIESLLTRPIKSEE